MLRKLKFYEKNVWPDWFLDFNNSPHDLVFLHGIMGGELYDKKFSNTRWIDLGILSEVDDLEYKDITPDGAIDINDQFIYARSTVRPPFKSRPYRKFRAELKPGLFCYDWRESIPIEARRLRKFLSTVTENKDKVNFVTHSMGGCVLLSLLMRTNEFDEKIGKIIFCAPPFHGALKAIRVIEDGKGTPLTNVPFFNPSTLRQSVATMPGLFQLLAAPKNSWPTQIELSDASTVNLKHPVRTADSLYRVGAWKNSNRLDLRKKILDFSKEYHIKKWLDIENVIERFQDRIYIIVGLNGKTTCCATRSTSGEWILKKVTKPKPNFYANGDGTVLFQSTFLPGLSKKKYLAEIPASQKNTHGDIMDRPSVIAGVKAILEDQDPKEGGLISYGTFIDKIDWSHEAFGSDEPELTENLDYIERALLRRVTPRAKWGDGLNPDGIDAELFAVTREAALQVMSGDDLESAAERIGKDARFLEQHIQTLLMPLLYS